MTSKVKVSITTDNGVVLDTFYASLPENVAAITPPGLDSPEILASRVRDTLVIYYEVED